MIDEILKPVGLPYRETQFIRSPAGDYIVYHDDVDTDGPDGFTRIFTHNLTVELYTLEPNPGEEAALEAQLNLWGFHWSKQPRLWVEGAQRYQTIYEFTLVTKI